MICLLNYICLLKDINIYLYRFILWWNLQFIIWSFTICPSPFAQILKLWPVIALSFFNTLISFMLYYFILRLALPQSHRCWDYKCTQLWLTMVALSFLKICFIHFMLCDFSLRLDWTSWSSCLSLPDAGIMGIHCHSCSPFSQISVHFDMLLWSGFVFCEILCFSIYLSHFHLSWLLESCIYSRSLIQPVHITSLLTFIVKWY